jgi:hypothetical protein
LDTLENRPQRSADCGRSVLDGNAINILKFKLFADRFGFVFLLKAREGVRSFSLLTILPASPYSHYSAYPSASHLASREALSFRGERHSWSSLIFSKSVACMQQLPRI